MLTGIDEASQISLKPFLESMIEKKEELDEWFPNSKLTSIEGIQYQIDLHEGSEGKCFSIVIADIVGGFPSFNRYAVTKTFIQRENHYATCD
ncbi:MAG: hypothetical protein PF440_07845 [Thiomicrorhabdus sp.]|nr:hypothetical protein [Thiomicrorhabdus sp.]